MKKLSSLYLSLIFALSTNPIVVSNANGEVTSVGIKKNTTDLKTAIIGSCLSSGIVAVVSMCLVNNYYIEKSHTLGSLKNKFFNFYKEYHLINSYRYRYDKDTNLEIATKLDAARIGIYRLLQRYSNLVTWFDSQMRSDSFWNFWDLYKNNINENNWNPGFNIEQVFGCMSLNELNKLKYSIDEHIFILSHIQKKNCFDTNY